MKIVHLITRMMRGGAQRVALATAAALREAGVEALLWCGPETGSEGSLHAEAAARGVPLRVFPHLVRSVDLPRDLLALRALQRACLEEKPDWVHTHSSKAGILGREAARRAGVPRIVHTVHGWGFTPDTPALLRRLYIELERRAARASSRLVFVSPADRMEGERLGIVPPGTGIDIPPGIDLAPYADAGRLGQARQELRLSLGLRENAMVGGFLGRLAPQKDPVTMMDVIGLLRPVHPELQWLVVGDGPLSAGLKERCSREPALTDCIHWAGLQEDPTPYLAAMDFLILPSRWEGAPLTLMEAMASALPVVASDLPGVRSLLPPDGKGPGAGPGPMLLARPGEASNFATHIDRMLSEPFLMQTMKQEARRQAFAHFGLQRMLAQLWTLYGVGGGTSP